MARRLPRQARRRYARLRQRPCFGREKTGAGRDLGRRRSAAAAVRLFASQRRVPDRRFRIRRRTLRNRRRRQRPRPRRSRSGTAHQHRSSRKQRTIRRRGELDRSAGRGDRRDDLRGYPRSRLRDRHGHRRSALRVDRDGLRLVQVFQHHRRHHARGCGTDQSWRGPRQNGRTTPFQRHAGETAPLGALHGARRDGRRARRALVDHAGRFSRSKATPKVLSTC